MRIAPERNEAYAQDERRYHCGQQAVGLVEETRDHLFFAVRDRAAGRIRILVRGVSL
jgi:hypothetical protein